MGTAHNGPAREPTSGTLILNAERQRPIIGLVRCRWPAQRSVPLCPISSYSILIPTRTKRSKISWSSHLSNLRRQGVIREWHDRKIGSGTEWVKEIDEHLNSAEVILLLISSDFIASEYCHEIEMKRAMERLESGEARVIPVILRSVDWSGLIFSKLQAAPNDGSRYKMGRSRRGVYERRPSDQGGSCGTDAAEEGKRREKQGQVLYAEYINCSGNERDRQIALGERILALEPNHKESGRFRGVCSL